MDTTTRQSAEFKETVLLLVDGDQHIFNVESIKLKGEGGNWCASELQNTLSRALDRLKLDKTNVQLIVRIYANFRKLSSSLTTLGLPKCDISHVTEFAAGFNASVPHFEFIDSGRSSDATFSCIANAFELMARQMGCRHVYLAACHDLKYLPLVAEYKSKGQLVTLVKASGATVPQSFKELYLRIVELGAILEAKRPSSGPATFGPQSTTGAMGSRSSEPQKPCRYHPRGPCPFGSSCRYFHDPTVVHQAEASTRVQKPPNPVRTIPINGAKQRIDLPIPAVSDEDRVALARRQSDRPGLCHLYQLTGHCSVEPCNFGHEPLSERLRDALRHLLRFQTCKAGAACRRERCFYAHGCSRPTCTGCDYGSGRHAMDTTVHAWVKSGDSGGASPNTKTTAAAGKDKGRKGKIRDDKAVAGEADGKVAGQSTGVSASMDKPEEQLDVKSLASSEDLIDLS